MVAPVVIRCAQLLTGKVPTPLPGGDAVATVAVLCSALWGLCIWEERSGAVAGGCRGGAQFQDRLSGQGGDLLVPLSTKGRSRAQGLQPAPPSTPNLLWATSSPPLPQTQGPDPWELDPVPRSQLPLRLLARTGLRGRMPGHFTVGAFSPGWGYCPSLGKAEPSWGQQSWDRAAGVTTQHRGRSRSPCCPAVRLSGCPGNAAPPPGPGQTLSFLKVLRSSAHASSRTSLTFHDSRVTQCGTWQSFLL